MNAALKEQSRLIQSYREHEASVNASGTLARARLHDALRPYSLKGTARCRRVRIANEVQVQRTPEGTIRTVGLCTCGSVHGCPSCAPKIFAVRAEEITAACTRWRDEGSYVSLVTLTIAHSWGDDLKTLRIALGKSWSRLWQGRQGQRRAKRLTKYHHIRTIEVTHGEHGYHPHVHALLFHDKELTDFDKQELGQAFGDNVAALLGEQYRPDVEHGCVVDESYRADYVAKLGLEVAAVITKKAKHGNSTMWQVAAEAAKGHKGAQRIWMQYQQAMFGSRQLCWSKGARKYFGLRSMQDAEIVAEVAEEPNEPSGVAVVLAQWPGAIWDHQAKTQPYWYSRMVKAMLTGPYELAMLPGQHVGDKVIAGHVAYKREPLHPVPWRRDQSTDHYVIDEDEERRKAECARYEFREWLIAHGGTGVIDKRAARPWVPPEGFVPTDLEVLFSRTEFGD